jgi:3-dehydroquinate dehydratase II
MPRGSMAKPVYVLNGPNLNLLGTREPDVYGRETLADIEKRSRERGRSLKLKIEFRQTNSEPELIGWVQEAATKASAIIINAAAYTHTSIALHDALKAVAIPVIEVHLSNIYKRESFRHTSYVSPAATGVICGLGGQGYELALEAAHRIVNAKDHGRA